MRRNHHHPVSVFALCLALGLSFNMASGTDLAAKPKAAAKALSLKLASEPTESVAARLRDAALEAPFAYDFVSQLTTRFGARPAGSDSERRAAQWSAEQMKALGLENVRIESFPLVRWERGAEKVEILGDASQSLVVTTLGGSNATGPDGVTGEAVLFDTFQQMLDAPAGTLTGKIAVVLQPTAKTQDGSGYGYAGAMRRQGPVEAKKRGAVAFLMRSLGTHDHRFAHTGATVYDPEAVPGLAISPPDADQLQRLVRLSKTPIRLRVLATPRVLGETTSQNVIGEIRGSTKPDEVIAIGGHLDSWDLGTGAIDDGAGVAITLAALKAIKDQGLKPTRTIRVVFWGAEEVSQPKPLPGLAGGVHYAKTHGAETHAISESDFGAGVVYRLQLPAALVGTETHKMANRVMSPIKVMVDGKAATGSGPDTIPSVQAGVPPFNLMQDGTDYFNYHHTADDILERIDPVSLRQNVAAWVATLWLLSEAPEPLRPAKASEVKPAA